MQNCSPPDPARQRSWWPLAAAILLLLLTAATGGAQSAASEPDPRAGAPAPTPPSERRADAAAADDPQVVASVPADQMVRAPAELHKVFKFFNREIATLRATVLGSPPAARASAAGKRLGELVDQGRIRPVAMVDLGSAMLFTVDGQSIFAVTAADLEPIAGETMADVTETVRQQLELALDEAEELRAPKRLLHGLALAVGATLALLFVLWLFKKLRRAVERALTSRLEHTLSGSVARQITDEGQRHGALRIARAAVSFLHLALAGAGLYLYLTFVMGLFPWTRPWGEALGRSIVGTVLWVVRGLVEAVPGLAVVAVIFLVTRQLARLSKALFTAIQHEKISLPGISPEAAQPTRKLVNAVVWLMALVAAYPYIPGSGSEAFKGLGVIIGLMVSLGSTGTVSQILSGFVLIYTRALRVGDFVTIGIVEGTVIDVELLSTKIRKLTGEEVTVPNSVVLSQETTNFSRNPQGVALQSAVTIGYDAPWRRVHALLEQAARETPGIRAEPAPVVYQTSLSDFYPEYTLVARLETPESRRPVRSALHAVIQDLFNENGIQIMSPHYEADPPEPVLVPRERWGDEAAPLAPTEPPAGP